MGLALARSVTGNALRAVAGALAVGFALMGPAPAAAAQLVPPPTAEPTVPPTVPDTTTAPVVTEPPPAPSTATPTTRRATTSTVATTTTIRDITVPTVEPDPASLDLPGATTGGGGISPIFSVLSIAGFVAAGIILFRTWRASTIREQGGQSG